MHGPCWPVSYDQRRVMMLVKHEQLTEQIIKGFYTVYRALGYGFLEKVYENSLAIELRKMKLEVVQQGDQGLLRRSCGGRVLCRPARR